MEQREATRVANKIEVLLHNYKDTSEKADFEFLISYLNGFKIMDLVVMFSENHFIFRELNTADLEDYWYGELISLPAGLKLPNFTFKKPNHSSSLEFIMGYVLYLLLATEEKLDDMKFFNIAKRYHSFFALKEGVQRWLTQFYQSMQSKTPSKEQEWVDWAKILTDEAKYHGTPGYLLLTNFYFCLTAASTGDGHLQSSHAEKKLEEQKKFDVFIGHAFKNLLIAELCESQSEAEIHNAYFGYGFTFANPFGFKSIAELKSYFLKEFSQSLPVHVIQNLEHMAAKEFELNKAVLFLQQDPTRALDAISVRKETSLMKAARLGDLDAISRAYKDQKSLAAGQEKDEQGNNLLHVAVLAEKPEVIKLLIAQDKSLCEETNNNGDLPIDLAHNADLKSYFGSPKVERSKSSFFKETANQESAVKADKVDYKRN